MTSAKIRVVAGILALSGAYHVWMGLTYGQVLLFVMAGLSLVAGVGLWMKKPWSRFVVYLLCALTIVGLMSLLSQFGSYGWPYSRIDRTILAVTPLVIIFLVAVWMIVVTHRYFRVSAENPLGSKPQEGQMS